MLRAEGCQVKVQSPKGKKCFLKFVGNTASRVLFLVQTWKASHHCLSNVAQDQREEYNASCWDPSRYLEKGRGLLTLEGRSSRNRCPLAMALPICRHGVFMVSEVSTHGGLEQRVWEDRVESQQGQASGVRHTGLGHILSPQRPLPLC